ncbi:MAG TPA: CcdC protein domain-containing protein, partial [Bacteroidia bacterium]|nr:CcdC protein domain-containing protein [Bacteroidia bacterium]
MKYTVVIFLVALILARRIRRSVGFQKYNQPLLIIRIVLFSIISLLFLAFAILYPMAFVSDGVGIIAGLILAYIATNHAQFEKRENGLYFKTHIWVEIVVITLFLARFIYRVIVVKDMFQPAESQDIQTRMQ